MAKPRLIILIRHAQSEGNKNRDIHQTIPDHRVKLTQDGWQQAYDAGRRLRTLLRADDTLHFFTSPYRRTRETTEGILATLTANDPDDGPSPFKRNNIKVYEEPRLREQDFGNFQPCSAEMERMWQERADYGHFFYRIPNGESAADAYDRISGFNESLWRQFGDDDFSSVCILVTHGLMSRVFLMKWYHWGVEYFEDLRNVNHCEFLIMRKEESGKYALENKLRTWSELRRERAALLKQKEDGAKDGAKDESKENSKLEKATPVTASPIVPRRWGGCPNGCSHDKNFRIRSNLADLVKRDGVNIYLDSKDGHTHSSHHSHTNTHGNGTPVSNNSTSSLSARRPAARRFASDESGGLDVAPQIDVTRAREEVVSSPDGTPSYITVEDRLRSSPNAAPPQDKARRNFLHVGRDFGGTYSGHTSDADSSEDEKTRLRLARLKIPGIGGKANGDGAPVPEGTTTNGKANGTNGAAGHKRDQSGMGRHRMANRLGDSPVSSDYEGGRCSHCGEDHERATDGDVDEELEKVDDELAKAEKEDKSIAGSVY